MRRDRFCHGCPTRLNGFRADAGRPFPGRNRITTLELGESAATVPGLSASDFN